MRLVIAAVGRLKENTERQLVEHYSGRIAKLARSTALGPLGIIEVSESHASRAVERRADEARRLLDRVENADTRVALDERGKALSSAAFARWIGSRRDSASRSLAFLIGGPDGHGEAALGAADLVLSLGAMTLPHGLARVVLAEQLYRAATLLAGHPYHRA